MKKQFKDRYILGEGYPYLDCYYAVLMTQTANENALSKKLKMPSHLMKPNCPKYRLVLERIK